MSGADGACWNGGTASGLVLAALDGARARLNLDPKRVVLGGYSSGGDVGYPLLLRNSKRFALGIFQNTAPWGSENGETAALLDAAAPPTGWRVPIRHQCHVADGIQAYTCASLAANAEGPIVAAGHDWVLDQRPGTHWDDPGTWDDFDAFFRPQLLLDWQTP